ncbi:DegV family protein [Spiroplasma chrysopicola]|uniref:DegV family protein n=1 Tax=Spiroplasma chrysopicola DF-1 TaxID=1276227 RepID=R4UH00_9MOLU|nr:DegV family protein [Spiroplasma chrysopicola]AGM25445.1 DegV family protein [Spiroplasma chrysopicola DF-1]
MSKKIAILTDSSAGFTDKEAKKYGIFVLPLHIILDNEIDIYDTDENREKFNFIETVRSGITKTSQASNGELMQKYDEILKDYDEIIHYPIAEKLSSQYATAYTISQEEDYKGKVHVVRNHTAAFALKQLVIYAQSLVAENKTVEEIISKTNEFEKESYMAMIPGSVDRLAKGGRVGKILISLISLLKIKVLIQWGETPKKIGTSRTINSLIETLVESFKNFASKVKETYQIFVLKTAECSPKIWDLTVQKLSELNVSYKIEDIAPIFLAHAGLDTIAVIALPQKYLK